MYLINSPLTVADLDACFGLASFRYGYSGDLRKDFVACLGALMASGAALSTVTKDRDQPRGDNLVGFGMSFFATEAFTDEAKTSLPPFLPEQILKKWRRGERFHLDKHGVERLHAGKGLTVVTFIWAVDSRRYKPHDAFKIAECQAKELRRQLARHRIHEYLEEGYGDAGRDLLVGIGLKVLRDYPDLDLPQVPTLPRRKVTTNVTGPVTGLRPYLTGAILAEFLRAGERMDTPAGTQALLGPPRYNFRSAEQQILKAALQDKTDQEIALLLHISLAAVKKRWQKIHQQVEEMDRDLPESAEDEGQAQRRRKLLALIRDHPEELWPAQTEKG